MGGNINLNQTSFAGIASALGVLYLTGATYNDMQDFINTTKSSGRISGGTINDDGDGTITVATGTGFIKSNAASAIEETYFFDWPQSVIVPLVDGSVNYIYVEYNAGTPRAWSTTTRSNIRLTDQFTLGRVYKDGGTLHIVNSGVDLANYIRLNHERLVACRWVEQASGGIVSEPAALKLKTTAGVFYVGSSKITTAGKDTSVADTFDSWYRDGAGGWNNELAETDVNNTKYDDGSGALADLPGASKYSARYVYIDFDGHIMVQYGQQANAKLSVIQAEEVPAPPAFLNEFAILAARVIVRDGDSPLIEIAGAYVEIFAYQGITRHDDLAGITSDQHHTQLHAASHADGLGDELSHDALKDYAANQHVVLPAAIVAVLSDHNKAAHDALGLSHDSLVDVSVDDHHAQLHAAEHEVGGGDLLAFADIPDFGDWLDQAVKQASNVLFGTIGCGTITVADGSSINLQEDITFGGATGENLIKFPDHLANALSFREGANSYLSFVTTNGSEALLIPKMIDLTSGQIKFPAAQVASADPNTQDDYEEGNWTPSLGGNTTYNIQTGMYIKVGRGLWVFGRISVNILGTGSTAIVAGLPFAADGEAFGANINQYANLAVNVYSLEADADNDGVSMWFNAQTALDGTLGVQTPIFGNGASITFVAVYFAQN